MFLPNAVFFIERTFRKKFVSVSSVAIKTQFKSPATHLFL